MLYIFFKYYSYNYLGILEQVDLVNKIKTFSSVSYLYFTIGVIFIIFLLIGNFMYFYVINVISYYKFRAKGEHNKVILLNTIALILTQMYSVEIMWS